VSIRDKNVHLKILFCAALSFGAQRKLSNLRKMAFHGDRGSPRGRGSISGGFRGRGGFTSGSRGRGRGRGGLRGGRGKPIFDSARIVEKKEKK
jgi:hypothetical protein